VNGLPRFSGENLAMTLKKKNELLLAISRTLRVLVEMLGMLNWKNEQVPKGTGGGVFGSARD